MTRTLYCDPSARSAGAHPGAVLTWSDGRERRYHELAPIQTVEHLAHEDFTHIAATRLRSHYQECLAGDAHAPTKPDSRARNSTMIPDRTWSIDVVISQPRKSRLSLLRSVM